MFQTSINLEICGITVFRVHFARHSFFYFMKKLNIAKFKIIL